MRYARTILSPSAVIFFLAATVQTSAEDLPGDWRAGKEFIERWCIDCHETAAGLRGPGVFGAPAFQDVADDRAVTEVALRAFLQTSHFEMPNFMLNPAEADDVISYILKLRAP